MLQLKIFVLEFSAVDRPSTGAVVIGEIAALQMQNKRFLCATDRHYSHANAAFFAVFSNSVKASPKKVE